LPRQQIPLLGQPHEADTDHVSGSSIMFVQRREKYVQFVPVFSQYRLHLSMVFILNWTLFSPRRCPPFLKFTIQGVGQPVPIYSPELTAEILPNEAITMRRMFPYPRAVKDLGLMPSKQFVQSGNDTIEIHTFSLKRRALRGFSLPASPEYSRHVVTTNSVSEARMTAAMLSCFRNAQHEPGASGESGMRSSRIQRARQEFSLSRVDV
jgi:hypothetical protein